MAEPNNYITATRKNFVSNDNAGRMAEKCIVEIQGTFLVKIRNDAFNGNDGENAYEHINKFLEIVGPIKINGLTQDRFRLSIFHVLLAGAAYEWFTKECIGSITTWDNMLEKFIIKFHHLSDHNDEETQEDDNPNKMDNVPEIFRIEGNLFDFETPLYATLGVVKFCKWLKGCFENFHELEYEVLANNPYLDINRTFGRDYEARNAGCTQENQEHKGDPIPEPSNYKVRRFEMMKYSFNDDEEYITIKESEYLNHLKDCLDTYREILRLIDEGWVVTTPDK
ncbi:hypothetical protein Tco_0285529 [Tanacetum coccineum]